MAEYDGYEVYVIESKKLPTEDWIKAKLIKMVAKDGKYGKMYVFSFQTLAAEYGNQVVWATVGAEVSNNPNSKTYKWYTGLFGRELGAGERVTLKGLIGKIYEIFLESKIVGQKTFQNVTRVRLTENTEKNPVEKIEKEITEERPIIKETPKPVKPVKEPDLPDAGDLDIDDLLLDSDIPL